MNQLNQFLKANFTCDKCGGEFQQTTAYSVAQDWEEFDEEYTYCGGCVKEPKYSNIDGRSLNKTGRTYQLGTREVEKDCLWGEVKVGGSVGTGFGVLWWGEIKID